MVSCQEPSPLKRSKHSSQCHPHDAALVNALSLCPWGWRQGVAHPKAWHIATTWRGNPSFVMVALAVAVSIAIAVAISVFDSNAIAVAITVAVAVTIAHRRCRCRGLLLRPTWTIAAVSRCHLCCIAISHCCHRCPCCWTLPPPSPLAIAVAIAIGHCRRHAAGHFQELLPWRGKNCIQPIEAKNAYLILCCSDSGRRIDQSRITDQVSSGDGQHQRWAASGEQWAASEGIGWRLGGSWVRRAETLTDHGRCCFVRLLGHHPLIDGVCDDVLDVIEGIAVETVIELMQEENNMRKRVIQTRNVYIRKNQKDVTHWVIRCAKKHCRWDNNENDVRGSRDPQKICLLERNVYLKEIKMWLFGHQSL
jgi:hypothetical protein